MDDLGGFGRNDTCWCGSGRKYKACHGIGPRSTPGAPILEQDDESGIWIAPHTKLAKEALGDLLGQMSGAPIYAPSDAPKQRPVEITRFSAEMAAAEPLQPSLPLAEIGKQRFDVLEQLGLLGAANIKRRLGSLSDDDFDALVHATFSTAKATLDRLIEQVGSDDPPAVIWSEAARVGDVAGQTLLWADHYLIADPLAEALLHDPTRERAHRLEPALARLNKLRPLIEAGVLALVPQEVARLVTAEAAMAVTETDLKNPELVSWLVGEMLVEGPTAREVVFVSPRDHDAAGGAMYFHGHINPEPAEDGTFTTIHLGAYDPDFDYSAWIAQTRRQTAAAYLQELNLKVATAGGLSAQYLATTPFEGRLLRRKGEALSEPSALVHAAVPELLGGDPATLARVAQEDEAVEALRRSVRRAFRRAREDADRLAAAEDVVEELQEQAELLKASIRTNRIWKVGASGAIGVGSLAVGAAAGGLGALASGGLGLLASAAASLPDLAVPKGQAAYAIYLADKSRSRGVPTPADVPTDGIQFRGPVDFQTLEKGQAGDLDG